MTADAKGGVWTYCMELVRSLAPRGIDFTLAVMGGEATFERRREAFAAGAVEVHQADLALEWMQEPWGDIDRAAQWLLGLEQDLQPELVHLNGYALASEAWTAPVLVAGHSCVLSWWDSVERTPPPARLGEYRRRVTEGLSAADAIVAPTAAMLGELERLYGTGGKGAVIPNGLAPIPSGGAPKQDLIIGAGRIWDAAKNLAALERVAKRVEWPIAIAGYSSPEPVSSEEDESADADPVSGEGSSEVSGAPHALETIPKRSGVHVLGKLERAGLLGWLRSASIFVLPARYEPFGLGPLEAALSGCVLVLGDIASLREVWGGDAVYVDPFDDASLVGALEQLIAAPQLREALAERSSRRATIFTAERMAESYLELYERLLRVPSRAVERAR